MRIIAGKFKGHKLVSFDAEHIRPTTDRVKESLFNIISGQFEDGRVLDLYAGTGCLGLEALSRGAISVDAVENHGKSIQIIHKNVAKLKVEDQHNIYKKDAVEFLKNYHGDPYQLVLIDPPFPAKVCLKTLEALEASTAISEESWVVIEHSKQEPVPDDVGLLRCVDRRSYGDKLLAFYRKRT